MRTMPTRPGGPVHGGPERPGRPGSSPSTLPVDGLLNAVRDLRSATPRHTSVAKVAPLKALKRGAY